jgi:hypothetical protein
MTSTTSRVLREAGFLRVLRGAALIAVVAGAASSLGLMLYAGRHQNSRILQLLFAAWVLSPFTAAVLANAVSQGWPVVTRATLNATMLVLTLGSLAIYGNVAFGHTGTKIGFVFLMVPLGSWLLLVVVVPMAGFISGKLSGRGDGA